MNSPVAKEFVARTRKPAFWTAATMVAGALVSSGCATNAHQRNLELFARSAPAPLRVSTGAAMAVAETAAANHEGDFVLAGVGDPMEPFYASGTVVVVHPTSYFLLRPGMPVVYVNRRGTAVAHMLVEKEEGGWVVAGINNLQPDDDLITPINLVGVITQAFVANTDSAVRRNDPSQIEPGGLLPSALLH